MDRCESCHLGTREPVVLTKANMGDPAFTSHPNKELLKIHDPERFGCTPCHGGNGVAISSVVKAHGENKFWLWPMHHRENFEAGCQQCHVKEIVTEMADTLNTGREIFRLRGCMACHRYEGFDRDNDEMTSVNQQMRATDQQKAEWVREIGFSEQKANNPRTSNAEAQRLYQHANDLRVRISGLDAKMDQFDQRSHELVREVKKVGPSLKEVRMKLRKEWIPVWIQDPHKWRDGTKMPTFRLEPNDVKAIAAFIWQSGVTGDLPKQPAGDPEKGREAFETRGCMACHSMGEGGQKQGGTFAANLSREGEKANYDYLVRWVHDPRQRTLPYCPYEKKDLTAEDYKSKGLPFVFDLDHSRCPNDGHELQVQQMTPMPSLRLSEAEARDIASYLMTRKHNDASYQNADYLDDPKLKEAGLSPGAALRLRRVPRDQRSRGRAAHRHGAHQGRLETDRAPGFCPVRPRGRKRRLVHPQGLFRAQASKPGDLRPGQGEGEARQAQDAELQPLQAGERRRHHVPDRLGGFHHAGAVPLSTRRTSGKTLSRAGGWSASIIAWGAIPCT